MDLRSLRTASVISIIAGEFPGRHTHALIPWWARIGVGYRLTLTKLQEQQRLPVLRVSDDDVLKETEAVLFAILRAAEKEVV
jgi:hypothetical protein